MPCTLKQQALDLEATDEKFASARFLALSEVDRCRSDLLKQLDTVETECVWDRLTDLQVRACSRRWSNTPIQSEYHRPLLPRLPTVFRRIWRGRMPSSR